MVIISANKIEFMGTDKRTGEAQKVEFYKCFAISEPWKNELGVHVEEFNLGVKKAEELGLGVLVSNKVNVRLLYNKYGKVETIIKE